jgi:hypothetical protein
MWDMSTYFASCFSKILRGVKDRNDKVSVIFISGGRKKVTFASIITMYPSSKSDLEGFIIRGTPDYMYKSTND